MTAAVVDLAAYRARRPADELAGNPLAAVRVPVAMINALRYGGVGESETPTGVIRVIAAGRARTFEEIADAWDTVMTARVSGDWSGLHPLVDRVTWHHTSSSGRAS